MSVRSKAGAAKRSKKPAKKTLPAKKVVAKRLVDKKPAAAAERMVAALAASEDDSSLDQELRDMVMGALREVGGQDYLVRIAQNPRTLNTFVNLLGRFAVKSDPATGAWSGTVNIYSGVNRGPKSA